MLTLNTAYQYDELGRVVEINALGQRFTYHDDHSPFTISLVYECHFTQWHYQKDDAG
ncbi:hypothetical protein AB4158_25340 [Vibrio splendidus]